jgi:tetratricopeptide (TPR) repeat protein
MAGNHHNHRLAALVAETRTTYEALARRINKAGEKYELELTYGRSAIAQWIAGHTPHPQVRQVVAHALSDKLNREIRPGDIWPQDNQGSQGAVQSATLDGMDRRTVLRLLVIGLGSIAIEGPTEQLANAAEGIGKADPASIGVLRAGIAHCRRLDDCFGAQAATRSALAQRQLVRTLLRQSNNEAMDRQLNAADAELAQLLGWLAFDLDDPETAIAYFKQGVSAAGRADDEALGGYVLAYRGIIEKTFGDPREGLAWADAAFARASKGGTATTLSWMQIVRAASLARLGPRGADECHAAIEESRALMTNRNPDADPAWIYHFTEPELAGQAGVCYLLTGQTDKARAALAEAVNQLPKSFIRERSIYLAQIDTSYALDGAVDEACSFGGQSLAIAVSTSSTRGVKQVQDLSQQLHRWRAHPAVRDLNERLRAAS